MFIYKNKLGMKRNKPVEIIKGTIRITVDRLYWISDSAPPKNVSKSFYFNIDNVFIPFNIRISSTNPSTRISAPSTLEKLGNTSHN